jgi:hypothetical protein
MRVSLSWSSSKLVLLLLVGCQSSGQSDLVMRELRMQEDQIYAMEDYLAQYQQLLCQSRAENAALKRRIRENGSDESLPAPETPSIRSPARTSPENEPNQVPVETDVEITEPDVPPLEETTSPDSPPNSQIQYENAPREHDSAVLATAYEQAFTSTSVGRNPDPDSAKISDLNIAESAYAMKDLRRWDNGPARVVSLRGTVFENEAGGGPRLQVDVGPLSRELRPTRFVGSLSLMILEKTTGHGSPRSMARWDFTAADAQAVLDEMPQRQSMRFHLELPPDTAINGETELWVRLVPDDGEKLLGHVQVDLRRPGEFASTPGGPQHEDLQRDAFISNGHQSMHLIDQSNAATLSAHEHGDQDGWTIARPYELGQSLGSNGQAANAKWRAATQPLPVVVAETMPIRRNSSVVEPAAFVEPIRSAPIHPESTVRTPPEWTPERNADSGRASEKLGITTQPEVLARPAWSPLR